MKKKLLSFIFAICLIIPCAVILSACGKDKDHKSPVAESTTITITYHTDYGNLSFETKKAELNNGIYLLTESDLPAISNEGDERIFDYWADKSGVEFDFNTQLNEDIELYATFTDAEMVWFTSWELYENFSYGVSTLTLGVGYNQQFGWGLSPYDYVVNYKKIKADECLDSYYTKSEIESSDNNGGGACFITSSNGENKIVTNQDITDNTYTYQSFVFIGNEAVNFYCNLPMGVDLNDGIVNIERVIKMACAFNAMKNSATHIRFKELVKSIQINVSDYQDATIKYSDTLLNKAYKDITLDDILGFSDSCDNLNYNDGTAGIDVFVFVMLDNLSSQYTWN